MKYDRLLLILITCLVWLSLADKLSGQLSIGVSAEQREVSVAGEPEFGVGVRLENDFKIRTPRIRFAWRMHASAFSTSSNYQDTFNDVLNDPVNAEVFDTGLSFLLEVKMPLFIYPYGGVGAAFERQNFTISSTSADNNAEIEPHTEWSGRGVTYDGFIGIKFSPIPLLKPYIEYRYTEYFWQENILPSNGRLLFGVMLSF